MSSLTLRADSKPSRVFGIRAADIRRAINVRVGSMVDAGLLGPAAVAATAAEDDVDVVVGVGAVAEFVDTLPGTLVITTL